MYDIRGTKVCLESITALGKFNKSPEEGYFFNIIFVQGGAVTISAFKETELEVDRNKLEAAIDIAQDLAEKKLYQSIKEPCRKKGWFRWL